MDCLVHGKNTIAALCKATWDCWYSIKVLRGIGEQVVMDCEDIIKFGLEEKAQKSPLFL
jgi:hypothetical protein